MIQLFFSAAWVHDLVQHSLSHREQMLMPSMRLDCDGMTQFLKPDECLSPQGWDTPNEAIDFSKVPKGLHLGFEDGQPYLASNGLPSMTAGKVFAENSAEFPPSTLMGNDLPFYLSLAEIDTMRVSDDDTLIVFIPDQYGIDPSTLILWWLGIDAAWRPCDDAKQKLGRTVWRPSIASLRALGKKKGYSLEATHHPKSGATFSLSTLDGGEEIFASASAQAIYTKLFALPDRSRDSNNDALAGKIVSALAPQTWADCVSTNLPNELNVHIQRGMMLTALLQHLQKQLSHYKQTLRDRLLAMPGAFSRDDALQHPLGEITLERVSIFQDPILALHPNCTVQEQLAQTMTELLCDFIL